MATIVFGWAAGAIATEAGFAAGSFGAAVIGGIGTAAGAYVDTQFLFRQKPTKVRPPNEDLKFSAADEGAPLATVFGTARVPVTCFWISETRRDVHSNAQGKGGTGANYLAYTYSADVAYAVCEGEVEDIEEVYANGKRIYQQRASESYDSFAVEAAARTISWHRTENEVQSSLHRIRWFGEFTLELKSPSNGPDLTVFVPGGVFEMSGWTAPYTANNSVPGYYTPYTGGLGSANQEYDEQTDCLVDSVRKDDATNDTFVTVRVSYRFSRVDASPTAYSTPPTPLSGTIFAEFPDGTGGQTIRLYEATTQFSTRLMSGFTTYTGTQDQPIDPTIEASEQDADVPAFRGRCYFVTRGLQLADFGNAPPVRMEAVVRRRTDHSLEDVIVEVCERAGLSESEVDASACSGIIVKGAYTLGAQSALAMLENLLIAYDVVVQGLNGVQTFFPRSQAQEIDIPAADLAAHDLNGDAERDFAVEDGNRYGIPREVTVLYRDPEKRLLTGSQRVRRASSAGSRSQQIDIGVVMAKEDAHAVAGRLLWLAEMNSRRIAVQLPTTYVGLVRESDRISFTLGDQPVTVLLDQVDRGDNGLMRCVGVREDVRLLDQPAIASAPGVVVEEGIQARGFLPPPPTWGIFDNACLDDAHANQPGFYWWAALSGDTNAPNTVFALYESADGGSSYSQIGSSLYSATTGSCTTALHDGAIPGFWDNASSLTVVLRNGAIGLESVTELQCLNGANRAIVGNEVIGYQNAVLSSRNTYVLTGLLRGLQGTEGQITEHFAGDRFVSLTNPGVEFVELNSAGIGVEKLYKVVPTGGRIADYPDTDFTPQGSSVRPLAPVGISVTRDGSNNATVSFTRRGRGVNRIFASTGVPIHEGRTAYYVDVMDPVTPTTRVRRMTVVTNDESASQGYTAAEQTTDGYTPGDPINFEIRQVSAWLGTGQVVAFTA